MNSTPEERRRTSKAAYLDTVIVPAIDLVNLELSDQETQAKLLHSEWITDQLRALSDLSADPDWPPGPPPSARPI